MNIGWLSAMAEASESVAAMTLVTLLGLFGIPGASRLPRSWTEHGNTQRKTSQSPIQNLEAMLLPLGEKMTS